MADMTQAEVNAAVNSLKAFSVEVTTRFKTAMHLDFILVNLSDILAQGSREDQRVAKLVQENAAKAIVSHNLDQEIKDKQEKVSAVTKEVEAEGKKLAAAKRIQVDTQIRLMEEELGEKQHWATYKIKEIEASVSERQDYAKKLEAKITELQSMVIIPG